MPSAARVNLNERLNDVDQLLQAHNALTRFKRAENAANRAGGGLQNLAEIIDALVTDPGQGRPAEVSALNRAAFVLLCSHLQGFVDDLHREAATFTLRGKVASIDDVVKLVRPKNANPHADVIEKMYAGIGIFDLMSVPHWNKCTNMSVKRRLTAYIEERNKIAHGTRLPIHKNKVNQLKSFVVHLADALDSAVAEKVRLFTGTLPW